MSVSISEIQRPSEWDPIKKAEFEAYKSALNEIEKEYINYKHVFDNIRLLRDRVYAHNDHKIYRDGDCYSEEEAMDSLNYDEFEKVLRWAFNACCSIQNAYGDETLPYNELANDINNLIEKTKDNDMI